MQINITGHHVEVTPPMKDYVHKKFERIKRHFDNITNVHVILSVGKKFQHKAEATVNLPGMKIFADSESKEMYASIDALSDKIDRQVINYKEKLSSHHGNGHGTFESDE